MMYSVLAKFYDDLVKDDKATQDWVDLITNYTNQTSLLELACGSAEITLALAKLGYQIDATDLSDEMLKEAKEKDVKQLVNFFQLNMSTFQLDKKYDTILCLCDSINYITQIEALQTMIKDVYEHLHPHGVFIFDMHSQDRLEEFREEFYEEGSIGEYQYSWSIMSEDENLYHNFCFYDSQARVQQEQHVQRVYTPEIITEILSPYFTFEVKTDFINDGLVEGEKYFYICKKEK